MKSNNFKFFVNSEKQYNLRIAQNPKSKTKLNLKLRIFLIE